MLNIKLTEIKLKSSIVSWGLSFTILIPLGFPYSSCRWKPTRLELFSYTLFLRASQKSQPASMARLEMHVLLCKGERTVGPSDTLA